MSHVQTQLEDDYGGLTDALVWAYVFEDCEIDIRCNNRSTSLAELINILSIARCYQRIDELGHNFCNSWLFIYFIMVSSVFHFQSS